MHSLIFESLRGSFQYQLAQKPPEGFSDLPKHSAVIYRISQAIERTCSFAASHVSEFLAGSVERISFKKVDEQVKAVCGCMSIAGLLAFPKAVHKIWMDHIGSRRWRQISWNAKGFEFLKELSCFLSIYIRSSSSLLKFFDASLQDRVWKRLSLDTISELANATYNVLLAAESYTFTLTESSAQALMVAEHKEGNLNLKTTAQEVKRLQRVRLLKSLCCVTSGAAEVMQLRPIYKNFLSLVEAWMGVWVETQRHLRSWELKKCP